MLPNMKKINTVYQYIHKWYKPFKIKYIYEIFCKTGIGLEGLTKVTGITA